MARRRSPLEPFAKQHRARAAGLRSSNSGRRRSSGSGWFRGSDRDVTYHIVVSEEPPFWRRHWQGILITIGLLYVAFLVLTGQVSP